MNSKIPIYKPSIGAKELDKITACVRSGMISSLGPEVAEFERKFATCVGVPYASAVSNGTCALHLILESLGITSGDEVIVPAFTFVSTANAVTYTGATPVFVDVTPQDWSLDVEKVEVALTTKTRAIVAVHLYGAVSVSFSKLRELAKRKSLHLIEDAAEALGSHYENKHVGGLTNFGAFSFYGNKTITTGEGGMVVSQDKEQTEKLRFLRDQAMDSKRRYYHPEIGFNYRMTAMQAAIGLAQLEQMDEFISKKKKIFTQYDALLKKLPIECNPHLQTQSNIPWLYSILFEREADRKRCEEKLASEAIETRPLFVPLPDLPMYSKSGGNFPVSKMLSERGLSLPSYPDLTGQDVSRIVSVISSSF